MQTTIPWKANLAFVLLCFFWGTTYLGIKVAVIYVPPFMLSGLRHLIAGILFVGIMMLRGEKMPGKEVFGRLLLIGLLMIVGGNAIVCWAEQYISSGLAAIIGALAPIYITLLSILFFKGFRVSFLIIIGLCMGVGGVMAIFYNHLADFSNPQYRLGIILMLLANISWAFGSVFIKRYPVTINMFMAVGLQMIMAGLINMGLSALFQESSHLASMELNGWLSILYLVVFGSLVGYGSYYYVISYYPPARVSIHSYINTIVAVSLGWLLLNEKLNEFTVLAILVILSGVILVNREYSRLARKGAS